MNSQLFKSICAALALSLTATTVGLIIGYWS